MLSAKCCPRFYDRDAGLFTPRRRICLTRLIAALESLTARSGSSWGPSVGSSFAPERPYGRVVRRAPRGPPVGSRVLHGGLLLAVVARVADPDMLAPALIPEAECVVLFHILVEGECEVLCEGHPR